MGRYRTVLYITAIATTLLLLFVMFQLEQYSLRVCDSITQKLHHSTATQQLITANNSYLKTDSIIPQTLRFNNVSGNSGDKILCENLIKLIEPPFPAMLIDIDLMDDIQNNTCYIPSEDIDLKTARKIFGKPIKIAVSIDLLTTINRKDYHKYNIRFFEDSTRNNYLKFFGKVKRAIPRVETNKLGKLMIPKNIDLFKEYWRRSRLSECVGVDMKREDVETKLPLPYAVNALAELRDLLVSYGMYPFLVEGTFLGWYRECGVIPHTHDMDFAVFAEQNNPKLLKALEEGKTDFAITRRFGKPESGYEFTLRPKLASFPIDLFFMYNNGVNESWIGGTDSDGQKYQFVFPLNFDPYCAAELYGQLFWISCHPETIMSEEYGPEWRKDHPTSSFIWYGSQKNSRMADKWSSKEMKEVYILY